MFLVHTFHAISCSKMLMSLIQNFPGAVLTPLSDYEKNLLRGMKTRVEEGLEMATTIEWMLTFGHVIYLNTLLAQCGPALFLEFLGWVLRNDLSVSPLVDPESRYHQLRILVWPYKLIPVLNRDGKGLDNVIHALSRGSCEFICIVVPILHLVNAMCVMYCWYSMHIVTSSHKFTI